MGLEGLQSYIIGVVLCIVVVTGGLLFLTSFKTSSPSLDNIDSVGSFNKSMNKANEVQSAVSDMSGSINNASNNNAGILGWLNALIGSAFSGIKAIITSFSFVNTMGNDVAKTFGIPPILIVLLLLIVTILVVFAVWSIATGGRL